MNCAPSSDLGGVSVHDCGGHLVLEKNYHLLVSQKPSIHLCKEVIYAPPSDVDLTIVTLCDEREVQSRLGTDYFLDQLYRRLHGVENLPK
ncbi:MAG: hypothetical protein ACXWVI_04805 [Methyloceanibacter sp.]